MIVTSLIASFYNKLLKITSKLNIYEEPEPQCAVEFQIDEENIIEWAKNLRSHPHIWMSGRPQTVV